VITTTLKFSFLIVLLMYPAFEGHVHTYTLVLLRPVSDNLFKLSSIPCQSQSLSQNFAVLFFINVLLMMATT